MSFYIFFLKTETSNVKTNINWAKLSEDTWIVFKYLINEIKKRFKSNGTSFQKRKP